MKTKINFLSIIFILFFPSLSQSQNLNWMRQTGGVFSDNTVSLSVDNVLNIYAVSNFTGNISLTTGQNFSSNGKEDLLVKKFSPNGVLQWARKFGGRQSDFANNITADANNFTYVTGTFQDTLRLFDQILLASPVSGVNAGFIIKLNPNGDIVWAKALLTSNLAFPVKAKADNNGNVLVCGHFEGNTDFDPGLNQNVIGSTGLSDVFFLKLDIDGNFVWVKKVGGTEAESISDFELDESGNIVSTGLFYQIVDFDPGNMDYFTLHNGGSDIFVHKLSTNGEFMWAIGMGGVGFDAGLGIDLAPNQDMVIVGRFSNAVDFNPALNQSFNLISDGSWDGFVLRLNNTGQYIWAKKVGSSQNDQCISVDISPNNNICVGGIFRTTVNFNPDLFPNQYSTANGGADVFHWVLNVDGSYNSHFTIGGLGNEHIHKVKIYSLNNILSVGNFSGIVDFDPSPISSNFTSLGNTDGFLLNVFNCVKPYVPQLLSTNTNICPGEMFTLTLPGAQLNGANQWSWYQNSCNTTSFATGNSITGSAFQNTTFYVRGTGGCVMNSECKDINISVFTDSLVNQFIQICQGDSVFVGNSVYTNSGLYVDTLVAGAGCDSVVFTNLNVTMPTILEQSFTICPGEEITVGPNIYRNNGIYNDTLSGFNGCDSVIVTEIIVVPTEIVTQNINLCLGEVFIVEDSVYTQTGTYINTFITPEGCENFIVTNLIVYPLEYNYTHNLCFGDTLRIGNQFYTSSLIVVEFLGSSLGCDSIVNHTINFFDTSFESRQIFLCEGDSLVVGENVYIESGLYLDSLMNIAGCDSIIQSNIVFFDTPDPDVRSFKICEGQSVLVNGVTYFAPGTYMDTLQTQFTCDSIIIIHLEVYPTFTQNFVTICSGDSILFGSVFLKNQGVYSRTVVSSLGCDSTSVIVLTVINTILEYNVVELCIGESITIGGSTYDQSGIYLDTLISSRGCDSIIQTTITIKPKFYQQFFQLCQGQQVQVGTNLYSTSGLYLDSLISAAGCDSIVSTNLVVNPKDYIIQNATICSGKSIKIGNNTYTQSGIYSNKFTNKFGCDSIVELRLIVTPAPVIQIERTICSGEVFKVGNFTFSMPGSFEVFLSAPNKCDTLLKLKLNVTTFNTAISQTGNTLQVLELEGAGYQWFICEPDTVAISGETNSSFTPVNNGDYLVKINFNNCNFESHCFSFVKSSSSEVLKDHFKVYPNPFSDKLLMEWKAPTEIKVEIVNVTNEVVKTFTTNIGLHSIDMTNLKNGMYFLKVSSQHNFFMFPIIKME